MDTHVKEGQLYVQHQKFGKKWKKNWFVLYPASQNGIARLEFYDSHSGSGGGASSGSGGGSNEKTRKLDKKIIRLSECISILPSLMESCPKDNMAAFCVETNEKTHVFAAEKSAAKEWMDTMCDIAFQGGGGSSSAADSNVRAQDLEMSENQIYYSREEANEFWVSVQRTEASERCGLSGSYWVKAESEVLILREPNTKRNILVWPYKLLRRYGRDRVMFSFEAGRRCDSGPGNFTFETKQGNEIFQLVDQAIRSQKALAEEHHLSYPSNPSNDAECPSTLQQLRNMVAGGAAMTTGSTDSSSSSSREADGDSGGSKPGSADGVLGKREGGDGGGGGGGRGQGQGGSGVGGHKGRSLPEPPPIMGILGGGGTPPKSPVTQQGAAGTGKGPGPSLSSSTEHIGLYSEPVDSVRLPSNSTDCLYADPVDSLKGQSQKSSNLPTGPVPTPRLRPVGDEASGGGLPHGGSNHKKQPDLYSHLYDHISVELNLKTSVLSLNKVGDGRGGGRGMNSNRRPPGGEAEGASSPSVPHLEHIYDEPEGCAKAGASTSANSRLSIYDEARLDPHSIMKQEQVAAPSGQEGNHSKDSSYSVLSQGTQYTQSLTHTPADSLRHSPQHGLSRVTPMPPAPRWPKPTTAPKPGRSPFARKEPLPLPPGKHGGSGNNLNNNNNSSNSCVEGGGGKELYSKVSKQKCPHTNSWYSQHNQAPQRAPDIIYDNLGDV